MHCEFRRRQCASLEVRNGELVGRGEFSVNLVKRQWTASWFTQPLCHQYCSCASSSWVMRRGSIPKSQHGTEGKLQPVTTIDDLDVWPHLHWKDER